jgi:hypothetical protein
VVSVLFPLKKQNMQICLWRPCCLIFSSLCIALKSLLVKHVYLFTDSRYLFDIFKQFLWTKQ